MTAPVDALPNEVAIEAVENLIRTFGKAQRALQMYLPNNPVYQRTLEQLSDAFIPVWQETGRLVLEIEEQKIIWEGVPLTASKSDTGEGLSWQLYKDGLRRLTILPGAESDEVIRFLEVVNRARLLATDAADDLLTLLWEQEHVLISYAFIEVLGEGIEFLQESPIREVTPDPGAAEEEVTKQQDTATPATDLDDADSTPYFLDEAEVRFIQSELEEEYRRDIRRAAIDALLDILETIPDADVRREAVELMESVLPAQLATGGFGAVAHILRELRVVVARVPGLDQELHDQILSFEERLSEPEILEQLLRALDEGAAQGDSESVGAVLKELKPHTLPTVLAHLGRSLDPAVRQVIASSVEDLARSQPKLLEDVLDKGPHEALEPVLELVARLKLQPLVPKVIAQLHKDDPAIRHAAVRSLASLGTPTAVDALDGCVLDADRAVRQAALEAIVGRGGSGGVSAKLDQVLFGSSDLVLERSERRTMFEAFAQLTGPAAMPKLEALLEPKGFFKRKAPAELRACAIYALARLGTFEARMVVDRFSADKDPVVRSAANTVLRDWNP